MRDSDQADPEGVFGDGDIPFSAADCEYSKGISIWVLGRGERAEGDKKSGPLPGAACPPYRLEEVSGESREIGRPRVTHAFLDEARSKLRIHRRKRKPLPLCWDRLRIFRKDVWFLILAGYSPSFIRNFFLKELPNLFPSLSYHGVVASVEKAVAVARAGELILGDDYRDALEHYRAGPWAHNAPDWLRKQYGVPLFGEAQIVDVEVSSKSNSGKQKGSGKAGLGKDSGAGVETEPVGGGAKNSAGLVPPSSSDYGPGVLELFMALLRGMAGSEGGLQLPAGAGVVGAGGVGMGVAPDVVSPDSAFSPARENGRLREKTELEKMDDLRKQVALMEEQFGPLNVTLGEYLRAMTVGLVVVLAERSSGAGSGVSGSGDSAVPAMESPRTDLVGGADQSVMDSGSDTPSATVDIERDASATGAEVPVTELVMGLAEAPVKDPTAKTSVVRDLEEIRRRQDAIFAGEDLEDEDEPAPAVVLDLMKSEVGT